MYAQRLTALASLVDGVANVGDAASTALMVRK
jgi:hypothetical protein